MPKKKKTKESDEDVGDANSNKTLNDYYNSRLTMATGPPNYKIILCGEYGVGKSALFRRFMNDSFTQEMGRKSTIGLDQASQSYDVHGQEVKVRSEKYNCGDCSKYLLSNASQTFERCIYLGVIVLKIFICGGISSDIRFEISFMAMHGRSHET